MTFRIQPILQTLGIFLVVLGLLQLIPCAIDFYADPLNGEAFLLSGGSSFFVGIILILSNLFGKLSLQKREVLTLMVVMWPVLAFFAAMPFMFSSSHLHIIDAFYEAMSALTTTNSFLLANHSASSGVVFWRGFLQIIGAFLFFLSFYLVLPSLNLARLKLVHDKLHAGSNLWSDLKAFGFKLGVALGVLTLVMSLIFCLAGLSTLGSLTLAMSIISGGGYLSVEEGLAGFGNAGLEWLVFMGLILAALPWFFMWQDTQSKKNHSKNLVKHISEWRRFLGVVALVAILIAIVIHFQNHLHFIDALRFALFEVTALLSGNGMAYHRGMGLPAFAIGIFILLLPLAGLWGGFSAHIGFFRIRILSAQWRANLLKTFYPDHVSHLYIDGEPASQDLLNSLMGLCWIVILWTIVLSLILMVLGIEPLSAFTLTLSTIAHIGPGLSAGDWIYVDIGTLKGIKLLLALTLWISRIGFLPLAFLFVGNLKK